MIYPFLLNALVFLNPDVSGRNTAPRPFQPKIRDTVSLLSHRWLVTSIERGGKKTGATAGSMPLYMNFFSNGGFDFVALGDGDLLVWKLAKDSVTIYRKSDPGRKPEAAYRIENIKAKTMVISGMQTGTTVRYFLGHQPGE